jgi:hypothetical protein
MPAGSLAPTLHLALAVAGGALAVALLVAAVVGALGLRPTRRLVDRLVLALLVAVALATAVGPIVAISDRPPADPLHLVYAAVALWAVPLARYLVAKRPARGAAAWIAVAGAVTLGALVRLWMTGG